MQSRRALDFHALHQEGILMLANCWDGASARIAEAAGSRALATSSAAVAWSHGYADGYKLPPELQLVTVRNIVRGTSLPLTVDVEDGYSDDPEVVAQFVAQVIAAGAVGINIEDGNKPPELLARKITAIRAAAGKAGVNLFINARCDVYLRGLAEPSARPAEMIRRAALYKVAGADGLFAAGASDEANIAAIVAAVGMPVNLLARTTLPSPARLAELGVRRLSAGSAPAEAMAGLLSAYTQRFLATGDIHEEKAIDYSSLNKLIAGG